MAGLVVKELEAMIQAGDTKGVALAGVRAMQNGDDPGPWDDALAAAVRVRDLARPPIDPPIPE
jgi:hypothetical protein